VTAPSPARSRPRRVLGWIARLLLVGLAIGFLVRSLDWGDRFEITRGGTRYVGTEVQAGPDGRARLLRPDGSVVVLDPAEATAVQTVPGVRSTLRRASAPAVGLVALLYALGLCAVSVRWWLLLRLLELPVTLRQCWLAVFRAASVGLLIPVSVGPDIYRVGTFVAAGMPWQKLVLGILLDRGVGAWLQILLAGAIAHASGAGDAVTLAMVAGAVVAPFAGLGAMRLVPLLPERARAVLQHEVLARLGRNSLQRPGSSCGVLVSSGVNFACQTGCVLVLVSAYWRSPPSLGGAIAATVLSLLFSAIPISPAGIAVGEAIFVFFWARVGVPAAPVVAALLTLRVVVYAVGAVAALLFLLPRPGGRSAPGPSG
jgi:uncharacterized membrane protein YbhN (UPF0104 family)